MKFPLFKKTPDSILGVDVGTANTRVVELSKHGQQQKLENYIKISPLMEPRFLGGATKGKLLFSDRRIADMLKDGLEQAGVEANHAYFSIPDFSTFFTIFSLPPMERGELEEAVRFEARQRVPLPITEVSIDWVVTKGGFVPRTREQLEILLIVVPNRVIDRYTHIGELCGLKLKGVEPEVFAVQRVEKDEEGTLGLVEIGAQSTTISIVDEGILKASYSFDIAGHNLTRRVSKMMDLPFEKAEVMKENKGLLSDTVKGHLKPVLARMVEEITKVTDNFYRERGKQVKKFVVAGATASMPGFEKYLASEFDKEIKISFPFEGMVYPSILEKELKKIGPGFTIATGMALKGLKELK